MHQAFPPLVEGNPESSVRVVTYEDLQCKDCAWLRRKIDEQVLPVYGDRVAFEHREFPLPKHEWARQAACVARHLVTVSHGLAVAFRRDIMADMAIITLDSLPGWIRDFASDYGADAEAAVAAMSDPQIIRVVDSDANSGVERNVEKTPTVFIGQKVFIEWVPIPELVAAIDADLARASG